ncbi:MAG: TetR family transcriptional regulator, partial [Chloroflexota bacterium]
MKALLETDRPVVGLRERKKAKTKAAIQRHALRLFEEQGYAATTIEQIAEAAEVSPSTFFRYFPTKDDVVLQDDLDPILIEAFHAQPAELSPIQAFRGALRAVFAELPEDEWELARQRNALGSTVPELRARMLEELYRTIQMLAEAVAERVGRPADDFAVRTLAGAIIGVGMSAMHAVNEDPTMDHIMRMDEGMALLEAG